MLFRRFVEVGRVALVSDGLNKGKLVSIVDVIDQTRVLVDGPETGINRSLLRLNQLHLTKLKIKFPHSASTRVVRKAWKAGNVEELWGQSTWAKKLEAKKKRATLTDFDRFKLRKARCVRNKIRTLEYHHVKKAASYNGTLYGKKLAAKSKKPTKKTTEKKTPKKK